ncbi:MAG: hypothetical protein ACJ790_04825 [Myxococcaceae bacterium]
MRGLKMVGLSLLAAVALFACEEGGKKEGLVGNPYPHGRIDVTGSPYQAYAELDNQSGEERDTVRVRGPSLVPVAQEQQAPQKGPADGGTK